jgi:hypothetical protein
MMTALVLTLKMIVKVRTMLILLLAGVPVVRGPFARDGEGVDLARQGPQVREHQR